MLVDKEQIYKIFHEKNAVQRKVAAKLYPFLERLGFHLTADHFYDITPSIRAIRNTYDNERKILDKFVDWDSFEAEFCNIIEKYIDEYLVNINYFGYSEDFQTFYYFFRDKSTSLYC